MLEDQPNNGSKMIYVLDTNILVDYVDILPGGTDLQPEEPTIDLNNAHLVIPTTVIRELASFKKEKSDRGKAARIALKRIRWMFEGRIHNLLDSYYLRAPLLVTERAQQFSVLPVHKNFTDCLPFKPAEDDMDGWIIVTTMVAGFLAKGLPIDGSASKEDVSEFSVEQDYGYPGVSPAFDGRVVLLTNDNECAARAVKCGLDTRRYGYKYPEPYTGRRDLVVPKEIFHEFFTTQEVPLEMWEEYMPTQPKLIANEFIVMHLEDPADYPRGFDPIDNPRFEHIGMYDACKEAIVSLKYASKFPVHLYNAGQAIYAEALMNPDIAAIICRGPAGSGKTYMATIYGYTACQRGEFIGVTIVPCESHSNLGALPGNLNDKMDPDVRPIKNALRNYLLNEDPILKRQLANLQKHGRPKSADEDEEFSEEEKKDARSGEKVDKKAKRSRKAREPKTIKQRLEERVVLIWNNWFSNIPIDNARGRDFSYELAIYDEFQDQTTKQADTLIKRLGKDGKIIITGDVEQIHAAYIDVANSGIEYASRQLVDSPLVAQVCFTEEEVMRHPLVKMVAKRQKAERIQQTTPEEEDE
ncbi:MAG: PhoH family protein [Candidatus Saccharibacteria bacterium]|nr:PhoH family protein [Candidatus Saccharibacteria bacterium]